MQERISEAGGGRWWELVVRKGHVQVLPSPGFLVVADVAGILCLVVARVCVMVERAGEGARSSCQSVRSSGLPLGFC